MTFATALVLLAALGLPPTGSPHDCFSGFQEIELPPALEWATEVRWAARDRIFWITQDGVVETRGSEGELSILAAAGNGRQELFAPAELGYSKGRLVAASAAYNFSEIDLGKRELRQVFPFWDPRDLDLHDGKIAILGAQRDAQDRYAPGGALVFFGDLGQDPELLRPIYFSARGDGAPGFGNCVMTGTQKLRFLRNGDLVVVPGTEGGVYLFHADGRLARTWTAAEVGFDSGCEMSSQLASRLALDQQARWEWVNERKVVDDIVPLKDGAGLLLRQMKDGKPSWQLKILRSDGSERTCDLPIRTKDPFARLKADSLDDEIGFLLSHRGYQRFRGWRTNKLTGERTEIPIKLHPDEPARWLSARFRP